MRDSLDKMTAMSAEARQQAGWAGLADYLSLAGRGLRKQALAALEPFVAGAVGWPFEARLEVSLWLLEGLGAYDNAAPLNREIIQPTLVEWSQRAPDDVQMHLWMSQCVRGEAGVAHLRRALELDPDCDAARQRLCLWMLEAVDFNQHHLPDHYTNGPAVDLLDIAEAEALWAGRGAGRAADYCRAEIRDYRAKAEAWLRDHPRK